MMVQMNALPVAQPQQVGQPAARLQQAQPAAQPQPRQPAAQPQQGAVAPSPRFNDWAMF